MKVRITPMTMEKVDVKVTSDNFFNDPKKMDRMKDWAEIIPVDLHGGYVPQDKSIGSLKETQECIRERFSLDTDGQGDNY